MYKVLSRDKRTNCQMKKRVYETSKTFKRYGSETIQRYLNWYIVEIYKMNHSTENWELIHTFNEKDQFNKNLIEDL